MGVTGGLVPAPSKGSPVSLVTLSRARGGGRGGFPGTGKTLRRSYESLIYSQFSEEQTKLLPKEPAAGFNARLDFGQGGLSLLYLFPLWFIWQRSPPAPPEGPPAVLGGMKQELRGWGQPGGGSGGSRVRLGDARGVVEWRCGDFPYLLTGCWRWRLIRAGAGVIRGSSWDLSEQ